MTHREPEPEDGLPPWQVASARLMHWALYVLLFAVPILGWMNASWRNMPVSFFGLFELPKLLATRAPGWGWTGDIHGLLAQLRDVGAGRPARRRRALSPLYPPRRRAAPDAAGGVTLPISLLRLRGRAVRHSYLSASIGSRLAALRAG